MTRLLVTLSEVADMARARGVVVHRLEHRASELHAAGGVALHPCPACNDGFDALVHELRGGGLAVTCNGCRVGIDGLSASLLATGTERDNRMRPLDIAALLDQPEPPIDWLWDGYLERGTVAQLHGDGGVGKSILALALVRAAIDGHDFLGRPTCPTRAVIIDGENPISELHRRLSRLGFRQVADHLRYWQAEEAIFQKSLDDAETMLDHLIDEACAELLVLDSQRALWAGEENEAGAVRPFYAMLRRVANTTGAAILVLHHDRRSGGYSGSSDLNAGVDSRLHLTCDETGRITLDHKKLRSAPEQPNLAYRLHLEAGAYAFILELTLTTSDEVFNAVTDDWSIAEEIAERVGRRRQEVQQELNRLTLLSRIEYAVGPPGRSRKAKCWRHRPLHPSDTRDRSGRAAERTPATTRPPHGSPPLRGEPTGRVEVKHPSADADGSRQEELGEEGDTR